MSEEMKKYIKELIEFESISSDSSKKQESLKTADFVISKLKGLGAETRIIPNVIEGKNPLLFAKIGSNRNKKTVLFYSHYDIQPALKQDGWDTDPFKVVEKNGYYYGRGVSDDKGPIVVAYQAIKELQKEGELPVNVCWLYEGEEESGSEGFEKTVKNEYSFFGKVDGLLIMDVVWFGEKIPSMAYGTRGLVYAFIEIKGPKKDQHSGYGGSFREPMTDLVNILSNLVSLDGKILVDGIYDSVRPLTEDEEDFFANVEFSVEEYKKALGYETIWETEDPKKILMNMWRYPSLTIHGIEGAFSGPGGKTVIPGKVIGKVSMRLVPDQNPGEIAKLFKTYITKEFEKLHSPNNISFTINATGDWWVGNPDNFLYKANAKAIEQYWKIKPSYTRHGGSIPIIPFMEKLFNASSIGVSTGQSTDGNHSQNEKIRIKNFEGSKEVIKLFLKELKD